MRKLTAELRTCFARTRECDSGATLVFVAVILVALLALGAFAIDFGRMYEERRQLQNGADAAAVAIAEDCVRGLCDGSYDEYAVAEIYVDANARDSTAWAWSVELDLAAQTVTVRNATEDAGGDHKFDMLLAGAVGFDGFTVGAEATVAWGGLGSPLATIPIIISECEWQRPYWEGGAGGVIPYPDPITGDPDWDPPYDDDNPPPVAWHLFDEAKPPLVVPWTSNPGFWANAPQPPPAGPPIVPPWSLPPIIDMDQDGLDDRLVASPLLNITNPGPVPVVLTFHDGGTTNECSAVAGQDTDGDGMLSGGFGWLEIDDTATTPCVAAVFEDWVPDDPGSSPSTGCDSDDLADLLLGEDREGSTVFIPFFDDDNDLNGANGEYHISGYGAFYVVGYNFGNPMFQAFAKPLLSEPCRPGGIRPLGWTSGNDDRCLVGYFTSAVYTGPGDIDPGGHGIQIFKFVS